MTFTLLFQEKNREVKNKDLAHHTAATVLNYSHSGNQQLITIAGGLQRTRDMWIGQDLCLTQPVPRGGHVYNTRLPEWGYEESGVDLSVCLWCFQVTTWRIERNFWSGHRAVSGCSLLAQQGGRLTHSGSIACGSGAATANYSSTTLSHTHCAEERKRIWCGNNLILVAVPSFTLCLFYYKLSRKKLFHTSACSQHQAI